MARINKPLNKILNSETKVEILRLLCQTGMEMTGRKIAEAIKVAPPKTHSNLQELVNERVLQMRAAGKAYLFRLNESLPIVKEVMRPMFKTENNLRENLFKSIIEQVQNSELKKDIVNISLFGSVFNMTDKARSDIDIYVVIKNPEMKERIEELFGDID